MLCSELSNSGERPSGKCDPLRVKHLRGDIHQKNQHAWCDLIVTKSHGRLYSDAMVDYLCAQPSTKRLTLKTDPTSVRYFIIRGETHPIGMGSVVDVIRGGISVRYCLMVGNIHFPNLEIRDENPPTAWIQQRWAFRTTIRSEHRKNDPSLRPIRYFINRGATHSIRMGCVPILLGWVALWMLFGGISARYFIRVGHITISNFESARPNGISYALFRY